MHHIYNAPSVTSIGIISQKDKWGRVFVMDISFIHREAKSRMDVV